MNTTIRRTIAAALAVTLCACAGGVREEAALRTYEAAKGPDASVQRNITNFDDALFCMDQLLIDNGVHDVVVLTEDLNDNTKKVSVGARDMLISAVSDMTRRSRAIRLIAFGSDVKNLQDWLKNSGNNQNVYNFQPAYNIRGSLSQLDENIVQQDKGWQLSGVLQGGIKNSASTAILGLDLSVISTKTMEVLPGVTSRNSVMLIRASSGTGQGDKGGMGFNATIGKMAFGFSYSFNVAQSDGMGGAARNLIELATVELFGKLLRIPYWQCLGIDTKHPLVQREVEDWYTNLLAEGKLVAYMQNQLRIMGRYNGPINGQINREMSDALRDLADAGGMGDKRTIDLQMFSYVLNLRNKNVKAVSSQKAFLTEPELAGKYAKKTPTATPPPPAALTEKRPQRIASVRERDERPAREARDGNGRDEPRARDADARGRDAPREGADDAEPAHPVSVSIRGAEQPLRPGEPLQLAVRTSHDAYLYCYLAASGGRSTMRIFPNPTITDAMVRANHAVAVPGEAGLAIKVGPASQQESVACFASDADPAAAANGRELVGRAFEVEATPLATIRAAINGSARKSYGETQVAIRKRAP
jgi:hypothetical protein